MNNCREYEWFDRWGKVLEHCKFFTLNFAFYCAISKENWQPKGLGKDYLLRVSHDNFLHQSIQIWCHLFLNRKDAHHWTKIVPEIDHSTFKDKLENIAGSSEKWEEYHHSLKTLRDKHIAHSDESIFRMYPDLSISLKTTILLYEHMNAIRPEIPDRWHLPDNLWNFFVNERNMASNRFNTLVDIQ